MNTKHLLLATLLAIAFAPATALAEAPLALQFDDDAGAPGDKGGAPQVVRERTVMDGADAAAMRQFDHAAFAGPLLFAHGRTVKNAPYSAEVINEQTNTLADGNQIANTSTSMSYRDSAGRTRQEMRTASGATRIVTIRDAVAGTTLILRPDIKTATRIGSPDEIARMAGERSRMHVEEMRKAEGDQVFVKRIERSEGEDGQRIREDVRIRVARDMADGQPAAGAERFGPLLAGAFGDAKWAAKASTRELGTKEIEGIKAQGKLRSYEIPAGEIGNRNPIVVSTETWYSPELQVTLLSRHSDPRSGERVYRLAAIKRDEPAASLFAIPSDYTVRDPMAHMRKAEAKK